MKTLTHDRGMIIDFIGKQHGSPALKADGSPTIVTGHEATDAKRVGWAAFFAALDAKHLALRFDTESGEHAFVNRHTRDEHPSPGEVSTGVKPH